MRDSYFNVEAEAGDLKVWRKEGNYWLRFVNGKPGLGDFLFNHFGKQVKVALEEGGTTIEDYQGFMEASEILRRGERWPIELEDKYYKPDRLITDMTRDPYIPFYVGCYLFQRTDLIEEISPPWFCFNVSFWIWRKRLIKDSRKHFVKRLSDFKYLASHYSYLTLYEDNFFTDQYQYYVEYAQNRNKQKTAK